METQELAIADALEALRRDIRHRVEVAACHDTAIPETEWLEIVEVLRRRFNALGMIERSTEVDEFGMDALAVRGTLPALDFLLRRYWRTTLYGVESIPSTGPALFVTTSFTTLPVDVLMVAFAVYRSSCLGVDGASRRLEASKVRNVENWVRFLMPSQWAALPFVQAFSIRLGGLSANFANVQRLLNRGHRVVCSRDCSTAIEAAIESGAPIIPVELRAPFAVRSPRPLGVVAPEKTVSAQDPALLTILRELGVFALPVHWSLDFGSPIPTSDLSRDAILKILLLSGQCDGEHSKVEQCIV